MNRNANPDRDWRTEADKLRRHARALSAMADGCDENADYLQQGEAAAVRKSITYNNTGTAIGLTQQLATAMYDARRQRDAFLDTELFGEPAWDMLLKLYAMDAIGRAWHPTKEVLSYAAATPTTAGRWLNTLVESGMIERDTSAIDERYRMLRITDHGLGTMNKYLRQAMGSYAAVISNISDSERTDSEGALSPETGRN